MYKKTNVTLYYYVIEQRLENYGKRTFINVEK